MQPLPHLRNKRRGIHGRSAAKGPIRYVTIYDMDRPLEGNPEREEKEISVSKEQLLRDLQSMRRQLEETETCRRDFLDAHNRYERLLESAPDALVYVEEDGSIALCNAQFEKLFGYEGEDLVGRDLETFIPERFRGGHRAHMRGYFGNPRVRPMGTGLKIFGLKKDGEEFPADISLSPLRSEGRLLVVAAVRDITERIKTEERLERNYLIQRVISNVLKISLEPVPLEEQMERVLDLILTIPNLAFESRGFIYLVEDEPGVLVLKAPRKSEVQPPCEKISFGKCLCGTAASTCAPVFADCIDERHEVHYTEDFPHGHYCIPIVSAGRALGVINLFVKEGHGRVGEEEAFLTAVADTLAGVIERYRAGLERERLGEQLAEAEKFSALGRITLNIADEMRNPLTSVGGFTRRLKKKLSEGTPEREYAEFILSEVNRLERILKNVLILSRSDSPLMETLNVRPLVEDALKFYEERCLRRSIRIERLFDDIPSLDLDGAQVSTAIGHLLANAIDAMPRGGTLSVLTATEQVRGEPYAVVKIGDTGEGIAEERQGIIFEPFYTTKFAPKGTGLGLSIVKKIMEDHGGFVRIESKVGKGATIGLYFPLRQVSPGLSGSQRDKT
jgi:PAS domain S-box-containing protein